MQSSPMPPVARAIPDDCAVLAQFGDAVALIDRGDRTIGWTSDAWRALPAPLATAADLDALEAALPELAARLARLADGAPDGPSPAATASPPARPRGAAAGTELQRWRIELAPLASGQCVVRLTDQLAQRRAQQRQLADREQLLFTSRTLSVGEMSTTLAHELNQPIGATANLLRGVRARLARLKPAVAPEINEALERALDQVMFAARVISRIREFTQSNKPKRTRVDIGQLLADSATLLDWDIRRTGARLELVLPAAPLTVHGDRVMLQQVLVNLIRNALDAMRSHPPAAPHLRLTLHSAPGATEAVIDVCDNGCGLDADAEARLFVPFASSKPTGMGIGLSICRSFIELHQGRLWFSRNPDGGATFHIGLPLLKETSASAIGPAINEVTP